MIQYQIDYKIFYANENKLERLFHLSIVKPLYYSFGCLSS